ncbi:hypothetical protein KKG29_00295 [Patescibacteria group bacterium]|nr:hypothetical protein [Patescibacteria group bacterium]MBU3999610.1 hypothetical protein [Patescibacteria group bacterium]MBU4056668.1 hypothetical protein [Patescibacteria group bacterium]MBU4368145.1 hypothetical protein [Patescibacteria group bacterium]
MIKNIFGSRGHTVPGEKGMRDIKRVIEGSDLSLHEKYRATKRFLKLNEESDRGLTKLNVKKEWEHMRRLKQIKNGTENIFIPVKGGLPKPEIPPEPSRYEILKRRISDEASRRRISNEALNDNSSENDNKFSGASRDKFTEKDQELGGVKGGEHTGLEK